MMNRVNPKIILGIVLLDVVMAVMGTAYLIFGPTTHAPMSSVSPSKRGC